MKIIGATVLDPTHLELTEPLQLRSGTRVEVAVDEGADRPVNPSEPTVTTQTLGFRQREHDWSRTHGNLLAPYTGQWIVLEGEEIVASGEDPVQLVAQARERGIRSPYIFYVEASHPGMVKIGL